jgi:folate-dependent tRNA-U54 methylase TrmFO/GidA
VTGALIDYILHANGSYFEPMNASWVLFPTSKKENRQPTIDSALLGIKSYWKQVNE